MRVMRPTPTAPPRALTRKLSESPTPLRYLATCCAPPSAPLNQRSCSFASKKVPGMSVPSRFKKSLNTFVGGVVLSSWSGSLGPFHVPSAQNIIFLLTVRSPPPSRHPFRECPANPQVHAARLRHPAATPLFDLARLKSILVQIEKLVC